MWVPDGGKLSTWYSVGFIRLQSIPHVGLCRFLTAVNCRLGILFVLYVCKTFRTLGFVGSVSGKLTTLYSIGFIRLHSIPHEVLCMFMTAMCFICLFETACTCGHGASWRLRTVNRVFYEFYMSANQCILCVFARNIRTWRHVVSWRRSTINRVPMNCICLQSNSMHLVCLW